MRPQSQLAWFCRLLPVLVCFVCQSAVALAPFVDSGKILRPGKSEVSFHTQIISKKEERQFNVILQLDENPLERRDVNLRYSIGAGEFGFLGGVFFKWVPFPDYKYQPALGASLGAVYNFVNVKSHYVDLHLRPFVSKDFETVVGKFVPYLAFPGSVRIKNFSKVQFPLRLTFGIRGELFFIHFHKLDFNAEFSTDLTKSTPSYFTFGVITHWM